MTRPSDEDTRRKAREDNNAAGYATKCELPNQWSTKTCGRDEQHCATNMRAHSV